MISGQFCTLSVFVQHQQVKKAFCGHFQDGVASARLTAELVASKELSKKSCALQPRPTNIIIINGILTSDFHNLIKRQFNDISYD